MYSSSKKQYYTTPFTGAECTPAVFSCEKNYTAVLVATVAAIFLLSVILGNALLLAVLLTVIIVNAACCMAKRIKPFGAS